MFAYWLQCCTHTTGCLPSINAACSVHPFKATGLSIGGSKAVRAEEGNWVDAGKQHISLTVIVPELPSSAGSEEPPPDLLDLHYSKRTTTFVALVLCL